MEFSYILFLVVAPSMVLSLESNILSLITHDKSIWKCVTDLDEQCVNSLGKRPVEQLFKIDELKLGEYLSIEKVSHNASEPRDLIQDVWDWDEALKTGLRYLGSRALKFKFGGLEARMFKSPSKADSVELTVEARRRDTGKSQRLYRVILPLIVGFKITGLVIFGIVTVKMFLLKATLVANTALLVAGGIVMKKLYDHGMGMLTQHQAYLNSHHTLPNYYGNAHDFSGYGYNSFESAANNLQPEVTDPVLGESDLHGQFSNHAIALAALNRTLMQQNQQAYQPQQHSPKRRWSHKWSPWHSHR